MDRKKILVMMPFSQTDIDALREMFREEYEVDVVDRNAPRQDLKKEVSQAQIILGEPDLELLQNVPKLEWIQMSFAGTDKYTMHPGFPKGVKLTNARGAFGAQMAEYAVGAVISNYRMFPVYQKQMEQGVWKDAQPKGVLETAEEGLYAYGMEETLEGKTVLILGCGNIGTETAKRFSVFGTTNIGIKRQLTGETIEGFDELYTLDEIDSLLPKADIVIGCVPNGEGTIGLFQEKRLKLMKKNSVLLNMGRGQLIDTEALVACLRDGWFRFVCLDVADPEPLPADNPLWGFERVLITPHISGSSFGHNKMTEKRIYELCCRNLKHYVQGQELENIVRVE